MTPEEVQTLEQTRARALRMLADCSTWSCRIETSFPARAAAALREIARICAVQAQRLDEIKEENRHG